MDKYLFDKIHESVPKMNPLICNGLAVEQVKHAEEYIDKVFRSAAASFPPELEYKGCQRCTPNEEYAEQTRERYSKQVFEMARSDFYMVKYLFSFNGVLMPPRYIYLPFLDTAGTMKVRGSQFVVNPVITDRLFSVDYDKIFLPITRDKLTFERITHNFQTTDGRKSPSVVWSNIHHLAKKKTSFRTSAGFIIKPVSTLAHYLFAKYGLTEAFKLFCDTDVIVGGIEIDEDTYHPDEYIICRSTTVQPSAIRGRGYVPTDLRVAVKRSDYNEKVEGMLGGLFYVADLFPDRIKPEWIDSVVMWRIILGHIIYKNGDSEGKLQEDINHHIGSLDEYIDPLVQETLAEAEIPVTDIYQLFSYIIENMTDMVIETDVASMYDKRLTVLRYLMLHVVKGIFHLTYKLKRKAVNSARPLTETDVRKAMDKWLKTAAAVSKITSDHGEVNNMSYPGDNKLLKITSRVILQNLATGNQPQSGQLNDASKYLHASLAEVGSYGNQPKFDPTGQSRINPYLPIGVDGTIVQSAEHKSLLDEIQNKIRRN